MVTLAFLRVSKGAAGCEAHASADTLRAAASRVGAEREGFRDVGLLLSVDLMHKPLASLLAVTKQCRLPFV